MRALGDRLEHAFYCGLAPTGSEIREALEAQPDVVDFDLGTVPDPAGLLDRRPGRSGCRRRRHPGTLPGRRRGRAPRLGHRSILANPCNPRTREVLDLRVKYREPIRPLAPMMTLAAAREFFELSDGASDANYNIYNYMASPPVRSRPPAHGFPAKTSRRRHRPAPDRARSTTDPLTHADLKALGRRIGVVVRVNTSFNVAGPIAQTAAHRG